MMKTLHQFLQRYHVPQALLATLSAWLVALVLFYGIASYLSESNTTYANPIQAFIETIVRLGAAIGMVVFPSCLVLVYPVYLFLPRHAIMWNSFLAAVVGALVGPVVMCVWVVIALMGRLVVSQNGAMIFGGAAMGAGITFGFSFTKLVARKFSREGSGKLLV